MNEALKNLPKFDAESMANAKYYKGGFDPKMNRREAALILGKKNEFHNCVWINSITLIQKWITCAKRRF